MVHAVLTPVQVLPVPAVHDVRVRRMAVWDQFRLRGRQLAVLSLDAKNNQVVNVVAGPAFRAVRDIVAS